MLADRPLATAQEPPAHRSTPGSGSIRGPSCGCSAWSPSLGPEYGARYFERPSDERVNELFNEATVFVQTSIHEGFCLPLLEAMAAGTPVVSTDAHGNRDFCRHEENCLIADADPGRRGRRARLACSANSDLRARLVAGGPRRPPPTTPGSDASTGSSAFSPMSPPRPRQPAAPRG